MMFDGVEYDKGLTRVKVQLLEKNDEVDGRHIKHWLGDYWNWLISDRIDAQQSEEVYFLRINPKPSESSSPFRAEFAASAAILNDQTILFPILNTMIDDGTFPDQDSHSKRVTTSKNENNASSRNLGCMIDGRSVLKPGTSWEKVRMESDRFVVESSSAALVLMDFPIPPGNHNAATDGYWIAIKKLPAHTDPYLLRLTSQGVDGYIVNITYTIYVARNQAELFDFQLLPKINEMVGKKIITESDAKRMIPNAMRKATTSKKKPPASTKTVST